MKKITNRWIAISGAGVAAVAILGGVLVINHGPSDAEQCRTAVTAAVNKFVFSGVQDVEAARAPCLKLPEPESQAIIESVWTANVGAINSAAARQAFNAVNH